MAERKGFEPLIRGYHIHTFQACAFDHSAISPHHEGPDNNRTDGLTSFFVRFCACCYAPPLFTGFIKNGMKNHIIELL